MNIREYVGNDHNILTEWLLARGMSPWSSDDMPGIGYVVSEDGSPIAMGFLRKIEKKTGMIDALCTNPSAPAKKRSAAIDSVVDRIISKAKEIGLLGLVCFSEDKNTLERSEKFGFKRRAEQTIIGLQLGG